jgi:hypothetical protein
LKLIHLSESPLCVVCQAVGLVVPGVAVDPKVSIRQAPQLRLDPGNLQTLCAAHRAAKTARGE